MAMWALFRKSFQKNLASVLNYDEAAALEIAGKAKPDYKRIIKRLPEFEKEDRFRMNIINCAMFSSFILHMHPRPLVDQLTERYCRNESYRSIAFSGQESVFLEYGFFSVHRWQRL